MVDATHEVAGGVGWGGVGMITFFALAHMVGATQHHVSCTCTHGWCYATSCFLHLHTWSALRNIMFLALAHMVGATQHHVSCTCTHAWCYATSCFLHLHTWSVLRNIMCLALAHMVGATQHHGVGWGGDDNVPCTCTHGRCHKMKCMSGLVSPTDALKKPLWQLWLTCSKKKRLTVMLLGPQIHCK